VFFSSKISTRRSPSLLGPKDNTIDMRLSLVVSSKVSKVQAGLVVSFSMGPKPSYGVVKLQRCFNFAPKIGEDVQFD